MGTTTQPASPFRWARARRGEGLDGRLLRAVAARVEPSAVRFTLGAASVRASKDPPIATLRFRDRKTLLSLALDPVGRFGDAFADGRVEVEGDLVAALESVYRPLETRCRPSVIGMLGRS